MPLFYINILIFMMSSACFKPEGSSLGRRLYVQVWYGIVCYMPELQYKIVIAITKKL
jgi:hypothetical protein